MIKNVGTNPKPKFKAPGVPGNEVRLVKGWEDRYVELREELKEFTRYGILQALAKEQVHKENLKIELEEHKAKNPVFYDNGVEQNMLLREKVDDLKQQNREYAKLLTKFTLLTKICRTESEFHEQFANACGEVVDLLEKKGG